MLALPDWTDLGCQGGAGIKMAIPAKPFHGRGPSGRNSPRYFSA